MVIVGIVTGLLMLILVAIPYADTIQGEGRKDLESYKIFCSSVSPELCKDRLPHDPLFDTGATYNSEISIQTPTWTVSGNSSY